MHIHTYMYMNYVHEPKIQLHNEINWHITMHSSFIMFHIYMEMKTNCKKLNAYLSSMFLSNFRNTL